MIANQTKIKFNQSRDSYFTNETLELFPNRFNILYGRNGSGKSSISQAISTYISDLSIESSKIEFIEPLTVDDKKHIFVFNESFIENNIKVDQDGLKQIVMLGEQVDLELSIKECEDKINTIINEKIDVENCLNANIEGSIVNYCNNLYKQILAGLTDWASRDKQIRGTTINSKRDDSIINEIINLGKGDISFENLKKEIESGIFKITQTKESQKITCSCPSLQKPLDIEDLNKMLIKKIEVPELTTRDKAILNIVESQYGHYISESENVFNDENVDICPLCLRPIDCYDKGTTIQMVKRILNREAQDYKKYLSNMVVKLTEISSSIIPVIENDYFKSDISNAQLALNNYNSILRNAKDIIQERLKNIYQPFTKTINEELFNTNLVNLQTAFNNINERIKEFNNIIDNQIHFKIRLIKMNKHLAYNELESFLRVYVALKEKIEHQKDLLTQKKIAEEQEQNRLKELIAKKQQVTIALSFINQALSYVFFDKNRLQLKKGECYYTLQSRKKQVKPTKISMGERNIIALCYFFACIFHGKEERDKYNDASLIIIDDPVSSFDFENRVGVISLLRWMSDQFLKGNDNTKILIMTHDLQTVFNLQKVRVELEGKDKDGYLELSDKKITQSSGLHNEYKEIMRSVYYYAKDKIEKKSSVIGNQMRKLMEAYSSFVYARDFMSMLHDDDVIKVIPKNKQLYYQNLMTRLVLNGESHEQEAANALDLTGFKFTMDEKVNVAKSIIMFLYYINPKHIISYLPDEAFNVLKQWQREGFDVLEDE